MNKKKEIIVDIDETGAIKAETFGFIGTDCELELDRLMKGLASSKSTKRKAEFYQSKVMNETKVKAGRK